MKKLAICGAVSVAKTTTVNCLSHTFKVLNDLDRDLADPGPIVEFVTEAARQVFEMFPDLDRASYEADFRIVNKIIANECRVIAETKTQVLVCDRSVLDVLVFARTHAGGHYERLRDNPMIQAHLKSYDKFCLLSTKNVPFVADDVRLEDREFREKLHEMFIQTFEDLGLPYEIVEGPTLDRVHTILGHIIGLYRPGMRGLVPSESIEIQKVGESMADGRPVCVIKGVLHPMPGEPNANGAVWAVEQAPSTLPLERAQCSIVSNAPHLRGAPTVTVHCHDCSKPLAVAAGASRERTFVCGACAHVRWPGNAQD